MLDFIVPCPLEIPFADHSLTQTFDKRIYVTSMPNYLIVLGDVRAKIASAKHVLHERPLAMS